MEAVVGEVHGRQRQAGEGEEAGIGTRQVGTCKPSIVVHSTQVPGDPSCSWSMYKRC